jgi:hypothetical protein
VDPTGQNREVDPLARHSLAFVFSIDQGSQEIFKLLLEDGRVDPSFYGNIAVRLASHKGFVGILRILLNDARVDPSDFDNACCRSWKFRDC